MRKTIQWSDATYVRSRTRLGGVTSLPTRKTLKTYVIHMKNRLSGQHLPGQHLPGQHTYLTSRSPFTITILLRTQLWTTSLAPSGAICESSIIILTLNLLILLFFHFNFAKTNMRIICECLEL